MNRLFSICALVLAVLGWTVPAHAKIGTLDQVPAATLLLPYFEVDLDHPNGVTTLLSINNASTKAVLAHVTFWSDLSVPTLTFNVYLTGYDVQTINLRDIFVNGVLPQTASAGQDPGDTISPHGPLTGQEDVNYQSCTDQLPYPTFAQILAQHNGDPFFDYKLHLQSAHTGEGSLIFFGQSPRCAGRKLFDRIARGYITVDTVDNCTLRFPSDVGYFVNGGLGDAKNNNVLWGDYFYVNPGENFAQGNPLVHIEAAPGTGVLGAGFPGTYAPDPQTSTGGQYTFYGRYVNWTAADNREPLATNFATRFVHGGAFSGGTDLIVWRDSKTNQGPFICPAQTGRPPWFPLGQEAVVIFDEQENPFIVPPVPIGPPPPQVGIRPFPAEAQRVRVGGGDLPVPFSFGWLYLNLNTTIPSAGSVPPEDPAAAQAWVETLMSAEGRFSVGFNAIQLDNATKALHFHPGP
jgi:hypothetical protein